MKSHEYELSIRDLLKVVLPTLTVMVGLAGILGAFDRLGLLPRQSTTSDLSTVILGHQAIAARSGLPGEIVLLGDSTCMMDVDAPCLETNLPGRRPVLNLGLIVWLGFEEYAGLLADHAASDPGKIKTVVLLVTPRKLTMSGEDGTGGVWQKIRQQGKIQRASQTSSRSLANWLARDILRNKLLSHYLVRPLEGVGDGSLFFGFPTEIDKYMTTHQGSLVAFGTVKPARRPEKWDMVAYSDLEAQSSNFRKKLPPDTKLIVGLTPIRESLSSVDEQHQRATLLEEWSLYLKADGVLTNLPAKLPDVFFADAGHLNSFGQRRFTLVLAREMTPFLKTEQ